MSAWKLPASTHDQSVWPISRLSALRPSRATNTSTLITNDPTTVAQPSRCAHFDVRVLPRSRITAAPSAGSAMITQSSEKTPPAEDGSTTGTDSCRGTNMYLSSVLQQARVVDRGRATGAEDGHDDRQPDHDLRGGDHHHEEGGHLAVEVAVDAGEGDQREVRGVQHQLDAHEHHDRVAAGEHADAADREQDRGQNQERCRAHASSPSSVRVVSLGSPSMP